MQSVGDPTRVRQIVSNLLSNALKFTRFGRVDVQVEHTRDGVAIHVRDTGIGIADAAIGRIFQPFAQGGAGIARQFGGTGLGLALTRRLCEAMQGRLEVSSQEGFGSCFTATLPLPSQAGRMELPALQGKVIALTSSRSGLATVLAQTLPAWGLEYQRLDTDASLAGLNIDLLISDCPECLPALRSSNPVPILLVTRYGSFLHAAEARALAPLEQLPTPLSRHALLQVLQRSLAQQPPTRASASPLAAQDSPRHRILLVEDNAVNQLVAKGMLGKLGHEVLLANQGREALDLLADETVDLVLMDCNMPVMDGYEASRQIRQDARFAGLPIIALTANALPDERERCRAAGMNDYLAKPFRRDELASLLEQWLPRSDD